MLKEKANKFPLLLEALVWFFYVALYKYAHYLEVAKLPNKNFDDFPHPSVSLYAIVLTLYIIPFYRYLIPGLLRRKRYGWMLVATLLYFAFVPKYTNWIVSYGFMHIFPGTVHDFYVSQFNLYRVLATHLTGWDFKILLTDFIAFLALSFTRYAFAVEQEKRLLEKEYFHLQVDGLKAQLNPHFLFNMLNSIYGMSLSGSPDTPAYILRMSDMMRYILYDGKETTVPIEKDLQFIEHYIAMEKKRYPEADISFNIVNGAPGQTIAPLLLIPFIENSFKHGAHRVNEKATVKGSVHITSKELNFVLENDALPATSTPTKYGGVGIENVRRRLALYYHDQHQLTITHTPERYSVHLVIKLNP